MKKIKCILSILLVSCFIMSSCQKLDEPEMFIPTIETGGTEQIKATSATIFGNIEHTSGVGYEFVVSTSATMNDSTVYTVYDTEWEKGRAMKKLSGLSPNTVYYYVFCATDYHYKIRGEVKSFTTKQGLTIKKIILDSEEGGEELGSERSFGTFLVEEIDEIYNKYGNMNTSYNQVLNQWSFKAQNITLTNQKLKLFAYSPYSNDVPVWSFHSVNVVPKTMNDFLYGSSEILTQDNTEASIHVKRALARVVLSITKNANSSFKSEIRKVSFTSDTSGKLYTSGSIDLTTGEWSDLRYDSKNGANSYGSAFYPNAEEAKVIEFGMIPTSFGEKEAYVCFNRIDEYPYVLSISLPASEWKAGYQYTYSISLGDSGISITDVTIEEWINNDGGDITVND